MINKSMISLCINSGLIIFEDANVVRFQAISKRSCASSVDSTALAGTELGASLGKWRRSNSPARLERSWAQELHIR